MCRMHKFLEVASYFRALQFVIDDVKVDGKVSKRERPRNSLEREKKWVSIRCDDLDLKPNRFFTFFLPFSSSVYLRMFNTSVVIVIWF